MKTAALIFDMDGTMVDSMPYHAKNWVELWPCAPATARPSWPALMW